MDFATVDTNWFRDRLADKRLSQRQLAKRMSLDPAAMSLMLRGKRRMSAAEAADIARYLGVEVKDVLARAGVDATHPRPKNDGRGWEGGNLMGENVTRNNEMIELPIPVTDGMTATLLLPRNLKKEDAQKIAAVVQALALQ